MARERTLLLDQDQILRKIRRMACEIHERHYHAHEVFLVGVTGEGMAFARQLAGELEHTGGPQVHLREITLDKKRPAASSTRYSGDPAELRGKPVVLADDVLQSGRTMSYAVRFLLDAQPGSLATAALVDRFHRRFPVHADYVGLTLSTNLRQHVTVALDEGRVFLE